MPTPGPAVALRRRGRSLPLLLVGLLFFFGPALSFVLGERPAEIENRRLASFPSLDSGWSFFGKVNTWAVDHLPLRDRAVSANTRLSEGVFHETPQYSARGAGPTVVAPSSGGQSPGRRSYPRVVQGRDGWLFYGDDFSGACEPKQSLHDTLAGLERFSRILQKAGRRFVLLIPPDKSTMNPDKLPATYLGSDCATAAKARFSKAIEQRPPSGYVDLRQALRQLQQDGGPSVWPRSDTHWTARGAALYAERVVTALQPGLWRAGELSSTGPVQQRGDLSTLLGTPRSDILPGYAIERPGVTVVRASHTHWASTSTSSELIRGRTLILGDSFTQTARLLLAPFFADAGIAHPRLATDGPADLVGLLRSCDAVVLEIVERSVVAGDTPITDPAFLDRLEAALG